jgi:hypothetical protein
VTRSLVAQVTACRQGARGCDLVRLRRVGAPSHDAPAPAHGDKGGTLMGPPLDYFSYSASISSA